MLQQLAGAGNASAKPAMPAVVVQPVASSTMETSLPGIIAAGDVRSGSTKQLGSAVGDGIAALLTTHRYLEAHHHRAPALIGA